MELGLGKDKKIEHRPFAFNLNYLEARKELVFILRQICQLDRAAL